jgi:hypothetical protein
VHASAVAAKVDCAAQRARLEPVRIEWSRSSMPGIRGRKAQAAVSAVLTAVADLIPAGVSLAIAGGEHLWTLRRVSDGLEDLSSESILQVEQVPGQGVSIRTAGPVPVFGIGSWIPFLPSFLAVKLTAQAILEFIQEVVAESIGQPWPAGLPEVRSIVRGQHVYLSFVSTDAKNQAPLPALPRALFE